MKKYVAHFSDGDSTLFYANSTLDAINFADSQGWDYSSVTESHDTINY